VGIGELVSGYRTVKGLGGALKILSPTAKVRSALSLTKLLPIFEIFDDEDTAVASFAVPGTTN
jgi:anti-sigma B factor antagonist